MTTENKVSVLLNLAITPATLKNVRRITVKVPDADPLPMLNSLWDLNTIVDRRLHDDLWCYFFVLLLWQYWANENEWECFRVEMNPMQLKTEFLEEPGITEKELAKRPVD